MGSHLRLKIGDLGGEVILLALVRGKILVENAVRRVGQVGEVGVQVVGESCRTGVGEEILYSRLI